MRSIKSLTTKKKILILAGVSILSLATWVALFYNGILQIHYPDRQRFPIQGIDISEHQGEIDWSQIDRQDVNFVYIKATEGGDFRDRWFAQNWQQAKNASIKRGAYHFFTFCKPGQLQAQNFISVVPVDRETLPPVIDLEFSGNCQRRPSITELKQELTDYIDRVTSVYHQRPILYVTHGFYDAYLREAVLAEYPLWARSILTVPNFNQDNRSRLFWQYSERGRIAGIKTLVDLNVFNGNVAQFQKLFDKSQ
jgi:lysozyme